MRSKVASPFYSSPISCLAAFRVDQVPILFSWASRGKLLDYGYDRNSALLARAPLVALLGELRAVGVEKVHVLAHSMGNFAVLEALANHDHVTHPLGLGEVVMAAPDVDSDQYRQIAPKVRAVVDGMTLYASSADKAMIISKGLAGKIPRAGDVLADGACVGRSNRCAMLTSRPVVYES
jgi:esterase/lipase superfamily enzyme